MYNESSHIEVSKSTKQGKIYVNYILDLGCYKMEIFSGLFDKIFVGTCYCTNSNITSVYSFKKHH